VATVDRLAAVDALGERDLADVIGLMSDETEEQGAPSEVSGRVALSAGH
jgi:hypothetical protein